MVLNVSDIAYKKYSKRSISWLIKKATTLFNQAIRERDQSLPCVSCGKFTQLQAGHFYSAGHYPEVRFNQDNVHGQCRRCNYFLSGNLAQYQNSLIAKIGQERFSKLQYIVAYHKRHTYKHDRFFLIDLIIRLKQKNKEFDQFAPAGKSG